jgi:type VII secretion integral membrane protein EccD
VTTVDEVRRISVHADGVQADLSLPASIPVGELIPGIYDLLYAGQPAHRPPTCLFQPGHPPLDASKTLGQNNIDDGCLLLLASADCATVAMPAVSSADLVEQNMASVALRWTGQHTHLISMVIVVALAATAGLVAVPEQFGMPNVLLGATAAATAAALAGRVARYGGTVLLTLTTSAGLVAVVALAACWFHMSTCVVGAALVAAAAVVLGLPARLAVLSSGLSAHISGDLDVNSCALQGDIPDDARRAQQILTALVVGGSTAATIGAITVAAGPARRLPDFVLTGAVAALLVLRGRQFPDPLRRSALLICGTVCSTALFIGVRLTHPVLAPWLCGCAVLLAAVVGWLVVCPPLTVTAPPLRRCVELLDSVLIAAVIPLACWSSGLYGLVGGISL